MALFIVDDDQMYKSEEVRATFQKRWDALIRSRTQSSGHANATTFKKFKEDLFKVVHDRILVVPEVADILNTQLRKVLQLIHRAPMLSETQGPSTHVCLISLVELNNKFDQKLTMMREIEAQEQLMYTGTKPYSRSSKGFDPAFSRPRGSFEDAGFSNTIKLHEQESSAPVNKMELNRTSKEEDQPTAVLHDAAQASSEAAAASELHTSFNQCIVFLIGLFKRFAYQQAYEELLYGQDRQVEGNTIENCLLLPEARDCSFYRTTAPSVSMK